MKRVIIQTTQISLLFIVIIFRFVIDRENDLINDLIQSPTNYDNSAGLYTILSFLHLYIIATWNY